MIGPRFVAGALSPAGAVADAAGLAFWKGEIIGDDATGELARGDAAAWADRIAALATRA